MRHFGKKGQPSGGNAAILVFVIAAFILLYILFLPKGERDKLLEQGTSGSGSAMLASVPGSVLLDESPGTLNNVKETDFDHKLPSFNLFTKKEDTVLKSVDSVYVETARGSGTK